MTELSGRLTLRLATRGSTLARWQADWVAGQLRELGHRVDVVEITTRGDQNQENPLEDIGSVGVFTKEIQQALLGNQADLAVHSLKDLPTEAVNGLSLAAVPPRAGPFDALVSSVATSLEELPASARVGTGSMRRQAQLRYVRPDLKVEAVRGNVDTRLRKLDNGEYQALILAEAGLRRLGLEARIAQTLPSGQMMPAVGQGALGVECRAADAATYNAIIPLNDFDTHAATLAERSLLSTLEGGCMAPIGAWGRVEGDVLKLSAVVLTIDGTLRLDAEDCAPPDEAAVLGRRVATDLLNRGAANMIVQSRHF